MPPITGKDPRQEFVDLTPSRRRDSLGGVGDEMDQLSVTSTRPKRKLSHSNSQPQSMADQQDNSKQPGLSEPNRKRQTPLNFLRSKCLHEPPPHSVPYCRTPMVSPEPSEPLEPQLPLPQEDIIELISSDEESEPAPSPMGHIEFPTLFEDERSKEENALTEEDFQAILPTLGVEVSQSPQERYVDRIPFGHSFIERNKNVELVDDDGFLRVEDITTTSDRNTVLYGRKLTRQTKVQRTMPQHLNELVWQVQMTFEQARGNQEPQREAIPLYRVKRVRQIVFTNRPYKEMSTAFRNGLPQSFRRIDQREEGLLYCRWKQIKIGCGRRRVPEEVLCSLSFEECDDKARGWEWTARLTNDELRMQWRGPTVKGGSFASETPVFDLDGNQCQSTWKQQYNFGDAFCGVGGASSGAVEAGLRLVWAFDKDEEAILRYRDNFACKGVNAFQQSVDEFLKQPDADDLRVDVLHMSFPCPAFSAANTTPNEAKNEENQAPLFANGQLLEKIRPRIATVEETDGLLVRHTLFFDALIHLFVVEGYSVRWGILRCDQFGVPQMRKRLCLIAAG